MSLEENLVHLMVMMMDCLLAVSLVGQRVKMRAPQLGEQTADKKVMLMGCL